MNIETTTQKLSPEELKRRNFRKNMVGLLLLLFAFGSAAAGVIGRMTF